MDASLLKLEFPALLERLSAFAASQQGKTLAAELVPARSRDDAGLLQKETLHAGELIRASVEPVLSGIDGAVSASVNLGNGAIALEPVLLRATGQFLCDVITYSSKMDSVSASIPGIIHDIRQDVPLLEPLGRKLIRITTADGELSPNASPALRKLSSRIDSLRSSLASKLSAIAARYAGTGILRDSPPTVRAGRFVLPVASSGKKSVKGIVHDRSESGATFFIEPSELVEAGNQLQEATMDLEQERRRILREATEEIRAEIDHIRRGIELFSKLDLIYARARYHLHYETRFPEEGPVNLRGIIHPLLPEETAVRSDMKLDRDWRVLVISGPNAGGKSVLLKAVALASVCMRAGLGAHVKGSSTIPFFNRILVSMGDNQSIAMHLSTYSARLSEQMEILNEGGSETLAIVDEPAAGTDPVTGAALAAVFLERTANNGVRTIVSTHMGQLKLLALEKQGFINGSMSFDTETLTPGFMFIPDLPGASCTLEAAAIAGFPRDLLSEASELAGDSFSLDSLVVRLRELEETRDKEVEALKVQRKKAGKNRRDLERNLRREKRKFEEIARQAETEKEAELKKIRSEADSLMVSLANSGTREERREARKKLSRVTGSDSQQSKAGVSPKKVPGVDSAFKVGDRVKVNGWPDTGTIENTGRTTVMVRLGPMLLKKELSDLTLVDEPEAKTSGIAEYAPIEEKPEAILLGQTVDEAITELDIKLDNCTALGLKRLRVVHGKGRLMQGVTEWLRRDRRVKSVAMAPPEEGGAGASIVLLKG